MSASEDEDKVKEADSGAGELVAEDARAITSAGGGSPELPPAYTALAEPGELS